MPHTAERQLPLAPLEENNFASLVSVFDDPDCSMYALTAFMRQPVYFFAIKSEAGAYHPILGSERDEEGNDAGTPDNFLCVFATAEGARNHFTAWAPKGVRALMVQVTGEEIVGIALRQSTPEHVVHVALFPSEKRQFIIDHTTLLGLAGNTAFTPQHIDTRLIEGITLDQESRKGLQTILRAPGTVQEAVIGTVCGDTPRILIMLRTSDPAGIAQFCTPLGSVLPAGTQLMMGTVTDDDPVSLKMYRAALEQGERLL